MTKDVVDVLRTISDRGEDELEAAAKSILKIMSSPLAGHSSPPFAPARYRLPNERIGTTGKLVIMDCDGKEWTYYVTTGHFEDGNIGEMFVRQKFEGGTLGAMLDAVATSISVGLQHGIPWKVYYDKFKAQTFEPRGSTNAKDRDMWMVTSFLDYFARWIEKHKIHRGVGVEGTGDDS